jgi:hypothetical protein
MERGGDLEKFQTLMFVRRPGTEEHRGVVVEGKREG